MDAIEDWFSLVRATQLSYGVGMDSGCMGPTDDDARTGSRSRFVGIHENWGAGCTDGACIPPSSSTELRLFYNMMDMSACIFLDAYCMVVVFKKIPASRQQQGDIVTGHTTGGPSGGLYVATSNVGSLPNEGVGRKGVGVGGS